MHKSSPDALSVGSTRKISHVPFRAKQCSGHCQADDRERYGHPPPVLPQAEKPQDEDDDDDKANDVNDAVHRHFLCEFLSRTTRHGTSELDDPWPRLRGLYAAAPTYDKLDG